MSMIDVEPAALASLLEGSRPFGRMSEEHRVAVLAAGEIVVVEAGATIVAEGQPSDSMYVLLDGAGTVLVRADEAHVDVGVVAAGDLIGELGPFTGAARSATIVATEPSRLVRLSLDALTRLFQSDPAFALACLGDLAERLQTALGQENQRAVDDGPAAVVLPPQDLSRLRTYQRRYYATAMRNLAKRHRLLVDRQFPRYRTSFHVTETDRDAWCGLFEAGPAGQHTPFTYHTSSGTLLLMQIVQDVGVNFRHLMHLRSELAFHPQGRRVEPGVDYQLESALADVVALREDRVALIIESRVHAPDTELVVLARDAFVILSIEPESMAALQESSQFGRYPTERLTGFTKHEPQLDPATCQVVPVTVTDDMGARYGRVSGDLNVVHTTRAMARLFGHPRPFVQGLCTANQVMRALTEEGGMDLQRLSIAFARRAFVGQTVEVRWDASIFEVLDSRGELLAFGEHEALGSIAG